MTDTGILKYIKDVMKDSDGAYSNKRFITTTAFLFMTVAFFANLFWGFAISEFVFNAMATVVMAGLASNVGENFASAWVNRKKGEGPPVSAQPIPPGEG
jgi:hypothetical protein